MRYLVDADKAFVCLDQGEDLFSNLEMLAVKESWQVAHVSGIGALKDIELGFYDLSKQTYQREQFNQEVELLSLEGNLTFKANKPFFHLHAVLGNADYQCFGGHLFRAKVAVVCEINIRIFNGKIVRTLNEKIGIAECTIVST